MKIFKIFSFYVLLFFSFQCGFSQSKPQLDIPEYYENVMSYSAESSAYMIKTSSKQSIKLDVEQVSYLEYLDIEKLLWSLRQNGIPNVLRLDIDFDGKRYPLLLKRRFLKSIDYKLKTSTETNDNNTESYFYNGVIEGEYSSWVTLAVINGEYKVLIASKNGNIEISHHENDTYKIYKSIDLTKTPSYKCHTNDEAKQLDKSKVEDSRSVGSDCVELYIECDFQSYLDNGSSVANTEAWALSIMNDVATIYNTINVPLVINNVFVWNSIDPYAGGGSMQSVRDSFVNQLENTYDGRVAQLFSTRDLGGGLAYGLGGLCGSFPDFPGPYSIATSLETSYSGYPNFSFTVNVVAHELGHIFGARHTHACVWGADFDSQIDDCGNIYAVSNDDQPEGQGCFDEMNPILPSSGGTIMSFCNLSGGGIDLANGFGSEVGRFIYDKYLTAPCATGTACASIPPVNDACVNAIEIQANGICNSETYDNILASASGITDPSCGMIGAGLDVWFTFTAEFSTYVLEVKPVANQVEDIVVSFYSGTCGSLIEEICESGTNEELSINLTGLTIDQDYYIRIIEDGSDEFGDFELCLVNESLPCHPAINQLVELYNNTSGPTWSDNSGWIEGASNTNCTPCSWYGIKCDNQDNIIEIDLYNNNLVGTVPISLGELTKLRVLKLMNNDLSGVFPDFWSSLDVLEFVDLSNNDFTGGMPNSLGSLLKLNTLYIENNNMDGELLPAIADLPLLNVYWTKNNNFSGCYPSSYSELCDIGSTKFTNNPLLPSGGNNFDDFCTEGIGGDMDADGFCFGPNAGEDCIDDDNTIYPSAPELCDGKDNNCDGTYDEGLTTDNIWTATGGGDWSNPSNWSLGIEPAGCHDVIFPPSGSSKIITISVTTEAFARSVTIFNNNTLNNAGIITIAGSDDYGLHMMSGGIYQNIGVTDIKNVSTYGIISDGSLENTGSITIENLGTDFEVYLQNGASFLNNGILRIR